MERGPDFVLVRTTVGEESEAGRLAGQVVEARLAACVQWFPIRSVYRWKGEMEDEVEFLLLAKTTGELAPDLIDFIEQHHSYDVPEIVVTPILDGLAAYLEWIETETG